MRGGETPLRSLRMGLPWLLAVALRASAAAASPEFEFPTANRSLLDPDGGGARFFVGTQGKDWTSGQFGCVRSEGRKFHEGNDIRCLERDRRGEPTDPVLASRDGEVAYVNRHSGLSNYGVYIVLRHRVDGLEAYTLYAHLSAVAPGVTPGAPVRGGQRIGTMGRTSNTRESITKERAHCHFEINLVVNERFSEWFRRHHPGERNDHGNFNGHNLLGVDPAEILIAGHGAAPFRFASWIRSRPVLCRVVVRSPKLSWARRYASLVESNPAAARAPIAGYELALTFNGIPARIIPRTAAEIGPGPDQQVISVDPAVYNAHRCAGLVTQQRGRWSLTRRGHDLLDLLTF